MARRTDLERLAAARPELMSRPEDVVDVAEEHRILQWILAASQAVPPAARRSAHRGRPAVRARWLAAGAVAAAAALAVGIVAQFGGGHSGIGSGDGHPGAPVSPASGVQADAYRAMRIVAGPGTLGAVGVVPGGVQNLTCPARSICYLLGSRGKSPDIARTTNGGATWTDGASLPGSPVDLSQGWLDCRTPTTCVAPFGTGMLVTSDGFAHYRVQPISQPSGARYWGINAVSCPTARHCVANVGLNNNGQAMVYSDDGGVTWEAARTPEFSAVGHFGDLRCDAAGACIAPLWGGTESAGTMAVLFSGDGGRSWALSPVKPTPAGWNELRTTCGDAHDCLMSAADNAGAVAWMHVTASGQISIRTQNLPAAWHKGVSAIACAAAQDCFVEVTNQFSYPVYHPGAVIEATTDGGRTWTPTRLGAALGDYMAEGLSCPVRAGCIGIAGNPNLAGQTLLVISNLNSGPGLPAPRITVGSTPTPNAARGVSHFGSWTAAQRAAGFRLSRPASLGGLTTLGPLGVRRCGPNTAAHHVEADFQGPGKSRALVWVDESNGGVQCESTLTTGTRLGTFSVDGSAAVLYGYCGGPGVISCSNPMASIFLEWSRNGVTFEVGGTYVPRAALLKVARSLRPLG